MHKGWKAHALSAALLLVWFQLAPSLCAQDPNYVVSLSSVNGPSGSVVSAATLLTNQGTDVQGWSLGLCHDSAMLTAVEVLDGPDLIALQPDFNTASVLPDGWTVGVVVSFTSAAALLPGTTYDLHQATYVVLSDPGNATEVCFCDTLNSPPVQTVVVADLMTIEPVQLCGTITATDAPVEPQSVVYALESPSGASNSVSTIVSALDAHGEPNLTSGILGPLGSLVLRSAWVCCGTFPDNHVLTPSEGQHLAGLVQAGVPVFIEGADVWGFDPPTPFGDFDGVYHPSVGNGDDTFLGMLGLDYGPLVLSDLSDVYNQESVNDDSTDRLEASPNDLAGPNAGVIWRDDGTGGAISGYATGVYYDTDPGFGKVIAQSWELGGYGGDTITLVGRYLGALGLLDPIVGEFRRADANGDGTVDIADPLFIESELFLGGPASPCANASDANDDGALDLADAITILSYLFVAGPTPPAPGPNSCGTDPTSDALDCSTYDECP